MRNIRCADCGKRYDYDADDFCPRCGSFNPPPDSGATRLEEELLSRFRRPDGGSRRPVERGGTPPHRPAFHDRRKTQKKTNQMKVIAALSIVVLALYFLGAPLIKLLAEVAAEWMQTLP